MKWPESIKGVEMWIENSSKHENELRGMVRGCCEEAPLPTVVAVCRLLVDIRRKEFMAEAQ